MLSQNNRHNKLKVIIYTRSKSVTGTQKVFVGKKNVPKDWWEATESVFYCERDGRVFPCCTFFSGLTSSWSNLSAQNSPQMLSEHTSNLFCSVSSLYFLLLNSKLLKILLRELMLFFGVWLNIRNVELFVTARFVFSLLKELSLSEDRPNNRVPCGQCSIFHRSDCAVMVTNSLM